MEILNFLFYYVALGCVAGVVAGLLGVGGGLIIVPVLVALFTAQGISATIIVQLAVGTSLATIIFTSLSSARAHHRKNSVQWLVARQLSLGIIFGGWCGALLAMWMGGTILAVLFGVFEIVIAAQMVFAEAPQPHRTTPRRGPNMLAGALVGTVSTLLGIGGGTLTVPWLVWHNVPIRAAIGTSAACGVSIALVGTLGFIVVGWQHLALPSGSTGFVYWPAVFAISVSSVLCAPLGAKLAHSVDQHRLKMIFAGTLAGLGGWMIIKAI